MIPRNSGDTIELIDFAVAEAFDSTWDELTPLLGRFLVEAETAVAHEEGYIDFFGVIVQLASFQLIAETFLFVADENEDFQARFEKVRSKLFELLLRDGWNKELNFAKARLNWPERSDEFRTTIDAKYELEDHGE